MSEFSVHPSSIVDSGASVGKGTRIWHFCHIMPLAVIGENCNIGQNVFIDNGVKIGNGVKIQNNVSVYHGVELADDVFVGPSVVFTNVINPRSAIERKDEFRPTYVGQGATIGANATIVCGVRIGAYALIGAGAVVIKDVSPYSVIVGNPGTLSGWVNSRGNKLVFNEQGEAETDGERFRKHEGGIVKA